MLLILLLILIIIAQLSGSKIMIMSKSCPPHLTQKPHSPCDGEWGWKDGWFAEAGLLAATEDKCETTESE